MEPALINNKRKLEIAPQGYLPHTCIVDLVEFKVQLPQQTECTQQHIKVASRVRPCIVASIFL